MTTGPVSSAGAAIQRQSAPPSIPAVVPPPAHVPRTRERRQLRSAEQRVHHVTKLVQQRGHVGVRQQRRPAVCGLWEVADERRRADEPGAAAAAAVGAGAGLQGRLQRRHGEVAVLARARVQVEVEGAEEARRRRRLLLLLLGVGRVVHLLRERSCVCFVFGVKGGGVAGWVIGTREPSKFSLSIQPSCRRRHQAIPHTHTNTPGRPRRRAPTPPPTARRRARSAARGRPRRCAAPSRARAVRC